MCPRNQFDYSAEDFEIQGILSKESKDKWLTEHARFEPITEIESPESPPCTSSQDTLRFRKLYQDIPDILQSQIVPQSHQILQDILYQRNRMNQVMN